MRIRQLARNAAVITAAATAMLGFSTGIAEAMPTTPTMPTIPAMSLCNAGQACTYGLSPRVGIYLVQRFPCTPPAIHNAINPPGGVYQVTNNCSTRVWTHANPPKPVCISPHSTKAGVGRFGNVTNVQVVFSTLPCPAGSG